MVRFSREDSCVFLCPVDVLVSEEDQMAVPVFKKNLTICVNLRAGRERLEIVYFIRVVQMFRVKHQIS